MMKFIAANLNAAKRKAKRALGGKAVVVSVRDLPSGDVEVTASDKPAPAAPEPAPKARYAGAAREAVDEGPFKKGAGARLNEKVESKFAENALQKLSSSLTGGDAALRIDMGDAATKALSELLTPHGVGLKLLGALIAGAKSSKIDDELYRLQTAFEKTFTFAPFQLSPAAPVMLIGPTGAGKTSSAAKLAAAQPKSADPVLLMTADTGRAGAIEQIQAYSDALGADYYIIESPFDVEQVLRGRRPGGGIILDTPGVSPYDGADVAALRSYAEACGAEPVLVLPAGGDAEEYAEWAKTFKEIGVRRCILTKFDAARRVGAGLRAVHENGLSLSHFSETAFISEGLIDASPEFLARRFIASRPGKIS